MDAQTWWDWWPHLFSVACTQAAKYPDDISRWRQRKAYERELGHPIGKGSGAIVEVYAVEPPPSTVDDLVEALTRALTNAIERVLGPQST